MIMTVNLKYLIFIYLLFPFNVYLAAVTDDCKEWFKQNNISTDEGACLTECLIAPVGMGNFNCPKQCKELCNTVYWGSKLNRFTYRYGLNKEEKDLVNLYPKEAAIVFMQKEIAEYEAIKLTGVNNVDDESDATRHFIWASLLYKELGPDLAKKFLDAHETFSDTSDPGRSMDLANNRAGLLIADKLKRENRLSISEIEKELTKALKEGTLVIIKKGK
jgi:hypothetical protein